MAAMPAMSLLGLDLAFLPLQTSKWWVVERREGTSALAILEGVRSTEYSIHRTEQEVPPSPIQSQRDISARARCIAFEVPALRRLSPACQQVTPTSSVPYLA